MVLRVVSGLVIPARGFRKSGTVTIIFQGHSQSGDVLTPAASVQRSVGPDRPFKVDPCFSVSLREITVIEAPDRRSASVLNTDFRELDLFKVHTQCFQDRLEVKWETTEVKDERTDPSRSEIRELSYMVIGEA